MKSDRNYPVNVSGSTRFSLTIREVTNRRIMRLYVQRTIPGLQITHSPYGERQPEQAGIESLVTHDRGGTGNGQHQGKDKKNP